MIIMLDVFGVPVVADFYDNEPDRFRYSHVPETDSIVLTLV